MAKALEPFEVVFVHVFHHGKQRCGCPPRLFERHGRFVRQDVDPAFDFVPFTTSNPRSTPGISICGAEVSATKP